MALVPHATGKCVTVTVFRNGTKIGELTAQSWECKRDATEITDDVLGEDRSRIDSETNFFVIGLKCYQRDFVVLRALLAAQAVDDSGVQPDQIDMGVVMKPKDGTKEGYAGKEGSLGAWSLSASGRTDRVMLDLPIRFRYFDPVAL